MGQAWILKHMEGHTYSLPNALWASDRINSSAITELIESYESHLHAGRWSQLNQIEGSSGNKHRISIFKLGTWGHLSHWRCWKVRVPFILFICVCIYTYSYLLNESPLFTDVLALVWSTDSDKKHPAVSACWMFDALHQLFRTRPAALGLK